MSSKFEDFLLAEYQRIAESHFSTVSAISQFFPYFIVIAGVPISAAGGEVGEMFHYAINQPITINRQGSAMIPIVNQAITTEKLSIYNPRDNSTHPLHGLRIKNTTELALMGGPITVFEGGAYAGDALLDDLGAGDERLVSARSPGWRMRAGS